MGLLFAVWLTWLYASGRLPIILGSNGSPLPDVLVFYRFLSQLLWLEIVIITLVALYMSAGSVSKEREDGTLDLMLTTPITPRQYVWGKVRGLVSYLLLLVAVPVLTLAIVSVYSTVGGWMGWSKAVVAISDFSPGAPSGLSAPLMIPEAPIVYFFMLLPFVACCVWIGMHLSVNRKTVLGAVTVAIVIVGAGVALFTACGAPAAGSIPIVGPVLNSFSPITNFTMLLNPYTTVEDYAGNEMASRAGFLIGALLSGAAYTFFVYVGLAAIVKNFDHTVRRLSGTG
jgi:ABC-type transport system involved in multi-copper enzyme maturation permease subunit